MIQLCWIIRDSFSAYFHCNLQLEMFYSVKKKATIRNVTSFGFNFHGIRALCILSILHHGKWILCKLPKY